MSPVVFNRAVNLQVGEIDGLVLDALPARLFPVRFRDLEGNFAKRFFDFGILSRHGRAAQYPAISLLQIEYFQIEMKEVNQGKIIVFSCF